MRAQIWREARKFEAVYRERYNLVKAKQQKTELSLRIDENGTVVWILPSDKTMKIVEI